MLSVGRWPIERLIRFGRVFTRRPGNQLYSFGRKALGQNQLALDILKVFKPQFYIFTVNRIGHLVKAQPLKLTAAAPHQSNI